MFLWKKMEESGKNGRKNYKNSICDKEFTLHWGLYNFCGNILLIKYEIHIILVIYYILLCSENIMFLQHNFFMITF